MDKIQLRRSISTLLMHATAAAAAMPLTAMADQAADATASAERVVIEEIVVTAQRRAERLTDAGVTVSVLGAVELRERQVEQIRDVVLATPNVDVKEPFPGVLPVVTIRGIGLDSYEINLSPSTGIYVDEIPLSSLALMNNEYFDLQRLEVVKGPQGTLYGRNSTAGAINIISAQPTDRFEGLVSAGYGSYEAMTLEGMVNAPLSDTVRLRFSGKTTQQSKGWWTNTLLPGTDNLGDRDVVSGRLQMLLNPSDRFEWLVKVETQRSRSEAGQVEGCGPLYCDTHDPPGIDGGDPYVGAWDGPAGNGRFPLHSDLLNVTSSIRVDVGPAELIAISGYIDFDRWFLNDGDGTGFDNYQGRREEQVKQFTQEVRLEKAADALSWTLGAIYITDEIKLNNSPRLGAFGRQFLGTEVQSNTRYTQDTDGWALFASTTWQLAPKLDLVTGVRYSTEDRKYDGGTTWTPQVGPFRTSLGQVQLSESTWSYRVQLGYKPSDNSLLYASASQGTKSGGFFGGTVTSTSQLRAFGAETLRAYEVGAKLQTARVGLGVAAFYYDAQDFQAVQRVPTVTGATIDNIPSSQFYGLDLEASVRPVQGLRLAVGTGYLSSRLGSFTAPTGAAIPAGNEAPNAPEWTVSGSARYEFDAGTLRSSVEASARYADGAYKDATNNELLHTPSNTIVDARAAVGAPDGRWEVAAWIKNLTDEVKYVSGVDGRSFGVLARVYTAPRTYGATVTYRFGN